MNVLLCDDHAMVRYGLAQILADGFENVLCGDASSAAEALQMIRNTHWDVAVLDISLPGRDGLDLLAEIKRDHPGLPVLMLTMHSEEHYATRAFRLGADGFLNKRAAPEELVTAVAEVLAGRKYVSPAAARGLAGALGGRARRGTPPELSNRELQVVRMIVDGRSVKDIAATMCLSVKTVSTYHTRAMRKLGVQSDAELVRLALEGGIAEPA